MKFRLPRFGALFLFAALALAPLASRASDPSVTAANVVASVAAKTFPATAGATITAGQSVYLDPTTNTAKLADGDASATTATVFGVALNGAASGQPLNICTSDPAFTPGFTSTAGAIYVQSKTAGGVSPVADISGSGWYITVMYVFTSTTKANFSMVRGAATP